MELDTVRIEPVPQKKGIILRHVEYSVKSDNFGSEVTRRYSDFQALNDLLIYRCGTGQGIHCLKLITL